MAFTQAQRVQIERYMGWPPPNVEPQYQAFVSTLQSTADGGSMPDGSRETYIVGLLTQLATVQDRLDDLWEAMHSGGVKGLPIDPVRGMSALRMEGRRLVHDLARMLNHTPLADAFSSASTVPVA